MRQKNGYVLHTGGLLPYLTVGENIGLSRRLLGLPADGTVEHLARILGVERHLRGTTLVPGTTALIGEDARQTAYIDHTELRVLLEAGDASKAGPILIRAELPPPERTQSNTITLPVIPVSEYKGVERV